MSNKKQELPEGFLWGAATSAYQVEGGNSKSDWFNWEKEGRVAGGQLSGLACDHYNRYESDFDLAVELGNNAHRLSIEWSRIEPQDGQFDQIEILHYRQVLESLKQKGLSTMVTLWHFTLPQWLADQGGWENRHTAAKFNRYTKLIADELGDLVDFWLTLNEPMIYLGQTYGTGVWPPGKKSFWSLFKGFFHLSRAHRLAYQTLHRNLDTQDKKVLVGLAKNVMSYEPYRSKSRLDKIFVRLADYVFNHLFLVATQHNHDYLGVNYYFHQRLRCRLTKPNSFFYETYPANGEVSDLGWEINPEGFFQVLVTMNRYGLPIYVTENGVASADDKKRPWVVVSMINSVIKALSIGVDVRGYFHWSLLDNFEWERGYDGRFGLVEIDFKSQQRIPRPSYYVYQDICRNNGIRDEFLERYIK